MRATAKEFKPFGDDDDNKRKILSGPPPAVVKPAVKKDDSAPAVAKTISLGGDKPAAGAAKVISLAPAAPKVVELTAPATKVAVDLAPSAVSAPVASPTTTVPPVEKKNESQNNNSTTQTAPPPPAATTVIVGEEKKEKKQQQQEQAKPAPPVAVAAVAEEEEAVDESAIQEADSRDHLNVVFIGHVDAGKSTLCGSILYSMDIVDKRTIEKYQKEAIEKNRESWFLAYIMDTNEEERQKGKTVEVGRANFETALKRFTILDAPGHKNYVPAMISGACHADVGVLVISARKGEFESGFEKSGQTREHAMLAFTLGIRKLIVVVNKMDDPTVKWDRERYDEIVGKISPYLKACGFKVKKDVAFMPIAALSGAGVKRRVDLVNECKWASEFQEGKSLIEVCEGITLEERNSEAGLRISVLASYVDRGVWAIGKIESGTLVRGSQVCISPTSNKGVVSDILIDEISVRSAKVGENICVKIKSPDVNTEADIQKGYVISDSKIGCKQFTATIRLLEMLENHQVFTAGYRAVLHSHTIAEECEIVKILWKHDPETGKPVKETCTYAMTGMTITVRISVPQSVAIEPFEQCPQLGRITLRDQGKSIAIGKVKKIE